MCGVVLGILSRHPHTERQTGGLYGRKDSVNISTVQIGGNDTITVFFPKHTSIPLSHTCTHTHYQDVSYHEHNGDSHYELQAASCDKTHLSLSTIYSSRVTESNYDLLCRRTAAKIKNLKHYFLLPNDIKRRITQESKKIVD